MNRQQYLDEVKEINKNQNENTRAKLMGKLNSKWLAEEVTIKMNREDVELLQICLLKNANDMKEDDYIRVSKAINYAIDNGE